MTGLRWDKIEVSFAKGLNQKSDARLVQAPELVRAVDVEFDEVGGLRLRYPFASIGANILGGGTIINCRRIYAVGDELILFTSTAMYSWSSQRSAWVLKGTHLAVKVDEEPVFVNTGDQVSYDRAQLLGTVVYVWSETIAGVDTAFAAAVDASTGAVLVAPTQAFIGAGSRPRVVALDTKILLFAEHTGGDLRAISIDPASPSTAIGGVASTILAAASFNSIYDVEKNGSLDGAIVACRRDVTTSYEIMKVDATAAVTSTTTKARTCDGPISVAVDPDEQFIQVTRANGTNIQADILLWSTLADNGAVVGLAVGSGTGTINNIASAYANGDECVVFWTSSQASDATSWDTDYNTVETSGALGTAATFIRRLALASRAFTYGGEVYVWLAFAGESSFSGANPSEFRAQLQNTYFLYRSDGTWCATAAWQRAAGFPSAQGHLPGVQLTSGTTGFTWCGGERRIIDLGENHLGYSDRGPRDITFTFDSNDARRVAKIGETVYISGSPILQYDGARLVECGFPLYPHYFGAIEVGTGNLADGVYTLKPTWRWDNAKGERDRSTAATAGQVTIAAGPNGISIPSWTPLYVTKKPSVAVEVWRTELDADADAPFYKTTSQDPTALTNPNRYIENDTTASTLATFNDEFADSTLTTKESHPENGSVLENLAPPPATIIVANSERLFLAGIAGDPHAIAYSKQRSEGEIVSFHEALRVTLPDAGGDITGLAFLNEALVVFKETAIYVLDGDGFDNTSGGVNYRVRLVSSTEGAVSHEAIALTPMGLVFKSRKGWYLLNRGWATEYIGAPVADYDSETVYSITVVEAQHQIRILTSARMLVLDYAVNAWAEWSVADGLHACIWNGTHHVLATAAVRAEQTSYATADYGWDVEMLVHLAGLQGFARCRRFLVLGEVRGAGTIQVRAGGYQEASYFDDKTWTISPATVGAELNFQHGPSRQQLKAFRIRLTSHTTAGEKPKLSGLTLEVGLKGPLFRHLPAAQKQ